jgi:hypothetical protein
MSSLLLEYSISFSEVMIDKFEEYRNGFIAEGRVKKNGRPFGDTRFLFNVKLLFNKFNQRDFVILRLELQNINTTGH